jgi:hypothetical protein
MTERKTGTRAPRTRGKKNAGRNGRAERKPADPEALDVSWDQPQPGYPAPERPRDRAEERKRRA